MSHEVLPHPSDVGLRARGSDRAEALASAVAGLAEIVTGGAAVRPDAEVRVAIDATEPDAQVVQLLDECLYRLDAKGFVAGSADVRVGADGLVATLRGEGFDPGRHGDGVHVKAVTWHDLRVDEGPDGVEITVWFDI